MTEPPNSTLYPPAAVRGRRAVRAPGEHAPAGLLRQLTQLARQGYWLVDRDGLTSEVNPWMCRLLGREREAVIGQPPLELVAQEYRPSIKQRLAGGDRDATEPVPVRLLRPEGASPRCWVEVSQLYDDGGAPIGHLLLCTEGAEVSPQARAPEAATPAGGEMVSVIREDGVYRMVNDAWCRGAARTREQVVGCRAEDVFPSGAGDEHAAAVRACLARMQSVTRLGKRAPTGAAEREVLTTYYPLDADAPGMRCAVVVTRELGDHQARPGDQAIELTWLRRALEQSDDAILVFDAQRLDTPVRWINSRMAQMWRLAPQDVPGPASRQIIDTIQAQCTERLVEPSAQREDRLVLRDGRVMLRRCVLCDETDGNVQVWTFRDITGQTHVLQALQAAEGETYAQLNAFPGLIALLDENLVYTFVNEAYSRLTGYQTGELIGRSVDEVLGPESSAEVRRLSEQAHTGTRVVYERAHGARTVQITLSGGIDRHTGRPRFYAFGQDITEGKRAEEALRRGQAQTRALLDAFPGYIAAIDQDFRYTYVNERLASVLGTTPDALLGHHMRDVMDEERFQSNRREMLLSGSGHRAVSERRHPATAQRPALDLEVTHVAGAAGTDGRHVYYVFGLDITDRKRAEEALIAARDEAERANLAKSQFLSHMSHELRTPLNAILGFAQLLGSDTERPLSAEQRHQTHEIVRGGRHLLNLINDVLDLGRIEAGKMALEIGPVALLPVTQECVSMVEPLAAESGVVLLPPDAAAFDRLVVGDRVRIKQVLLNLLGNAIKYNRVGGEVAVECIKRRHRLRVVVRDTGPGLSAAEQQCLFTPFERVHADASGVEGTGIGLALSRRLMMAMGGEIGVDSAPGAGSRFWIELPRLRRSRRATDDCDAAAVVQDTSAPLSLSEVLYIEDNPVNVVLMEAMLARLPGIRLVSEVQPRAGLERARRDRPHLILLDIQLPGMSGFDVLRELRADPATRSIPVIAVSANAMHSDIAAGQAAGFADYVTKPLELTTLLAAVQGALQPAGDAGATGPDTII